MFSFRGCYRIGCVVTAFLVTLWPMYEYNLDNDLVQINFKKTYSANEIVYPALTLCGDSVTISQLNGSTQETVLNGSFFDKESRHKTLRIEDYISTIKLRNFESEITRFSKSGLGIESHNKVTNHRLSTNTIFRRYQATRCFAVAIPFMMNKGISSMDVGIKKSIFNTINIPKSSEIVNGKSHLSVGLSYQNQYFPLLRHQEESQNVGNEKLGACTGFIMNVRGMEILHRRNRPRDPCNEYTNDNTTKFLEGVMEKLGCKPELWDVNSLLPICSRKQLNKSRQLLDDTLYSLNERHSIKPCRTILDLWYDKDIDNSMESCTDDEDTFHIKVLFNDLPFKEISFVPAYTIWNLLSSISIIFGLFFGVSLIQLPDLISKLEKRMDKDCQLSATDGPINDKQRIAMILVEVNRIKKDVEILKLPVIHQLQKRQFETTV